MICGVLGLKRWMKSEPGWVKLNIETRGWMGRVVLLAMSQASHWEVLRVILAFLSSAGLKCGEWKRGLSWGWDLELRKIILEVDSEVVDHALWCRRGAEVGGHREILLGIYRINDRDLVVLLRHTIENGTLVPIGLQMQLSIGRWACTWLWYVRWRCNFCFSTTQQGFLLPAYILCNYFIIII